MDPAKDFYDTSKRFLDFVHKSPLSAETAGEWSLLLMELYTKGLRFPAVEPDTVESTRTADDMFPASISAVCRSDYWEVFDPFKEEEPVACDLTDDMAGICQDLLDGMAEYEAGSVNNAIFEWRFGLDMHWGRHAVDALRALHCLRVGAGREIS